MQMNKNQMTMAIIGGVSLVGSLVFLALVYFFVNEDLEVAQQKLTMQTNVYNQNKAYSLEQAAGHRKNAESSQELARKAYAAVKAMSDRLYVEEMTAPEVRARIQADYKRFYDVQKEGDAHFVKDQTVFGKAFEGYINGDKLADADKDLVQRRWGDVVQIVDVVLNKGAQSVDGVEVVTPVVEKKADDAYGSNDEEKTDAYPIVTETYEIRFTASPSVYVDVLNALARMNRFVAVDKMEVKPSEDTIGAMFGVVAEGATSSETGRRRRRRAEAKDEEEEAKQVSLITDPGQEIKPLKVTLTVSTLTAMAVKEVK